MLQIIQYQKTGEITVEDLPDLKSAPGGILVQNRYSLISAGTERTSVETAKASLITKAKTRPDLVKQVFDSFKREGLSATYEKVMNRLDNYKELGYSSAGIVVESNVDDFKPGDRVACAGAGYASHSELVFIPKNLAVNVPDNVDLEDAAFTTLGSIALQGIRQTDVKMGENIAVIGLGLLGLITVQLLKSNGCRIIGLDISEKNFDLAKECGCDDLILMNNDSLKIVESFTKGIGTDAVIITASTKSNDPIEKAIAFARKKSRIVLVGVSGTDIPRAGFYEKELSFTISCSYGPGRYDFNYEQRGIDYPVGYVRWTEKRNMEAVVQLLSQGKLNFKSIITHKIPVKEGVKAYDIITGKTKEPYIGILIEYPFEIKTQFSRVLNNPGSKPDTGEIRAGFIGAGNFAQSNLLPYLLKEKVNLVTVVNRTPINAKSAAQKFCFTRYASDADEVLNDPAINTVFIATRHNTHAEYVINALQNGKNVFVEKPLAISITELQSITQAYNQSIKNSFNPLLMVGFNRRFSKPFNLIKDFFKNSKEPFLINYRVNAGFIPLDHWVQHPEQGGRIIGEACHFIDIFDFILNSSPVSLYATSIRSKNAANKNEDTISVTINYNNGSVANLLYLSNGDKSLPKEYCEISSGGLSAVMDDFKIVDLHKNHKRKRVKFNGSKGHKEEIENFVNVLIYKDIVKLSFESIYTTTLITFKILESLRDNKIIFFDNE